MKKICKSFLLFSAVVLLISVFTTVYTAKAEELTAFTYDYSEINQDMQSIGTYFAGMTDVELEYYIDNYVGMNKAAFESIKAVKEKKIGEFESVKDCNIVEYKDYIIADSVLEFEKKDVRMKVKFQSISQTVTPVSIQFSIIQDENKGSLGEKMAAAGMNTIMGMGTVFVVLIFLSLVISSFILIPVLEKKFKDKNKTKDVPVMADTEVDNSDDEEELSDDLELVAVITAAIAASENGSTDGFIVRSIKRSPGNKWKNA